MNLQGDLPAKLLAWAVPVCPFFLQPVFVVGYAFLFFVIAREARNAVRENLEALEPDESSAGLWWKSYLVILNFAWTCVDTERAREEKETLSWRIEGGAHFDEAAALASGFIVLTAHMGSYDVAAAVFAEKFGRKVKAVRAPEPTEELQAFRKVELEGQAGDSLSIAYNTSDGFLGIDLIRALSDGNAVAIQGDRVLFDVAPARCRLTSGAVLRVPKGPFALAMAARVPMIPVFVLRTGPSQFRIVCGKLFSCTRTGRDKDAGIRAAIQEWAASLEPVILENSTQWFVFEEAFEEAKGGWR